MSHSRSAFRPSPPSLTSLAGPNILIDEVRLGIQADSGRGLSFGRKRKLLSSKTACRKVRNMRTRPMNAVLVLSLAMVLLLWNVADLRAQNDGDKAAIETLGTYRKLNSRILGEERTLIVTLPRDYEKSGKRYPVLVVLDGSPEAAAFASFSLKSDGQIPPFIIVSVVNVDRLRDMNLERFAIWPTSGGGERFVRFLGEEVVPFIDQSYRTAPYRALYGHSAAGLMTIYALLTIPDVFEAYIAGAPFLGISYDVVKTRAEKLFAERRTLPKFLYIAEGDSDYFYINMYLARFKSLLIDRAPKDLTWILDEIPDAGHSEDFRNLHSGLKRLFGEHRFPHETYLAQGDDGVERHFRAMADKFFSVANPRDLYTERNFVLCMLGLFYKDRPADALKVAEYGLKLHPSSCWIYYHIAEIFGYVGEREKAVAAYDQSMRLNTEKDFRFLMAERGKERILANR